MRKSRALFFAFFQASIFCQADSSDKTAISDFTESTIISSQKDLVESNGESFGSATLKRISNLTSFPMFIKLLGQENKLGLADNSIIRISVKAKRFGDKKPYLSLSEEKDTNLGLTRNLLRANIYDGENLSCHFKIKNFLDKSGQPYILLSPSKTDNKFLLCDNKSSDKYLPIFTEDIPSQNNKKSLWIFEGKNDEFFLKNASNNGYLAPSLIETNTNKTEDLSGQFKDNESLMEYFKKSKKDYCCFGDGIIIQELKSFLYFSKNPLDKDNPFNLNKDSSSILILKGEHSDSDRYNASFGLAVKNGDIIRLEDPVTGKNLTVSSSKVDIKKDDYDYFSITLNGTDGLGSSSDNWIITFSDTSTLLNIGTTFMLQHLDTKAFLVVDGSTICATKLKDSVLEEQQKKLVAEISESKQKTKIEKKKKIESAVLSDQYINKNWFISKKKMATIDQKNLMRTGFENGAEYPRISEDDPTDKNQQLSLEIISTDNQSFIQPQSDIWKTVPLKKTGILLSGLLEEDVPDLLQGSSLTIKPLREEGVLWIEKSLMTKNRFSLTFLAQVNDGSELAIVLGNELSEKYKYKIILGSDKNTATKLIKRKNEAPPFIDKILSRVSASEYSLAKLRTGVTVPVWVSFFEGSFLVGQSQNIGENIILVFEEKGFLENINRIGFSCNTDPIIISNVSLGLPLKSVSPIRIYEKELSASPDVLLKKGFRQPDQFYAVFHSPKVSNSEIIFGSDDHDKQYLLNLSFSNGKISISKKEDSKESVIFKIDNEELRNTFGTDSSFWINYNCGLFFMGIGKDPCASPSFIFQEEDPLKKINQFSYSSKSNINKISINSGGFFNQQEEDYLSNELESSVEKNKMVGIMPYEYQLEQVDDWVTIKDFITRKTYFISRTAQKDADYSLLLSINTKGLPKMRWAWQPENENLMKEKFQARMMAGISDGLSQAAMAISGVGDIGETIAAAANIITTGATLAPAILAAKLNAAATHDYVAAADKIAVKDEQSLKIGPAIKVNESKSAIMNRFSVEKSLAAIKDTSASTRENFFMILSASKKIVNLTTSQHVLGTLQLKNSFFKVVDELYQYYDELFESNKNSNQKTDIDNSSQELINLLIDAYNNPFLFDNQNQSEIAKRSKWMSWANLLFRKILKKSPEGSVDIPPLFGQHFWLEKKLKTKGVGKVVFQAKGSGNLFVTFSDKPISSSTLNKEFYSFEFINSEKTTCSLKLSTFGAKVFSSENNALALNEIDFKKLFVSINNGLVSVGIINDNSEEEVLETFADPYPLSNESFIGFGTFNSSATISNIEIK